MTQRHRDTTDEEELRRGKLQRSHTVTCAECLDQLHFTPAFIENQWMLYRRTTEWLLVNREFWGRRNGLWYCPRCLDEIEREEKGHGS